MTKQFGTSIDGLIEQLHATEPMISHEWGRYTVVESEEQTFTDINGCGSCTLTRKITKYGYRDTVLSPKEVRKKAKRELRWIVAYGQINPDELLPYTCRDKSRIAEALGYSSDAHMGDVVLSCKLHLKMERYLSILRRIV